MNVFETNLLAPSRRAILKGAAGLAGAALLPAAARAADEAIGTFPAGVAGDSVFIGITIPRTGTYAVPGDDLLKGYELAIEHLNDGNEVIRMIAPSVKKGVLGKKVVYGVADSAAKPNNAVQNGSRFISENKAMLITGCVSSAEAVALNKLAQREHVIYLPGVSGSNDTTGKDCVRYSFRECFYGQTAAAAISPVMIKNIGKNKKVAYLIPDYTYGHTVHESMEQFLKAGGWTTATAQVAPLGAPDYSSYLLNIANSGADVFINVAFGADSVASTKQAKQFGVLDRMKMVVPNLSAFQGTEVGAEIMQGVYGTTDFWWTLAETNEAARLFVESFEAENRYKPRSPAHIAYTQLLSWADAVERAKTFNPVEVIRVLEAGHKLQMPLGEVYFRECDHQQVRAVPVVVGKKPSEMRNPEDVFRVVGLTPGPDVMPPCDSVGCKMPPI
jgi:branched-chain amino acid transport system substrate-binding protein